MEAPSSCTATAASRHFVAADSVGPLLPQAEHNGSLSTALATASSHLASTSSQLSEAQQAAAAATAAATAASSDAAAARAAAASSKEKWEDLVVCQICYEGHRDTVLLPCMHFLYCKDCLHRSFRQRQRQCPACRTPVSGQIVVHLNRE
jgi:hypothetical protein